MLRQGTPATSMICGGRSRRVPRPPSNFKGVVTKSELRELKATLVRASDGDSDGGDNLNEDTVVKCDAFRRTGTAAPL